MRVGYEADGSYVCEEYRYAFCANPRWDVHDG